MFQALADDNKKQRCQVIVFSRLDPEWPNPVPITKAIKLPELDLALAGWHLMAWVTWLGQREVKTEKWILSNFYFYTSNFWTE